MPNNRSDEYLEFMAWRANQRPGGVSQAAFDILQSTLANRVVGGTGSGVGATATFTMDPISASTGAAGNFLVTMVVLLSSSTPGDLLSLEIQRDGTPISITQEGPTDSAGNLALTMVVLDAPGQGTFTYRGFATNRTGGGHTVQFTACNAIVQETQ